MKKTGKTPIIVASALIIAMILAAIALLVGQAANNGWVFETENITKFGILIFGLILTLIRIILKLGRGGSLRKYEAQYSKYIGSAFSRPTQKDQKRRLLRAIANYAEHNCSAAISQLSALHKECGSKDDHSAVLLFLAISYSDTGLADNAIATYEELLKIVPENSTAWSNLGLLYRQQGKNERSISCIEKALEYDEDNAYAWNNLAQAHLAASNWEKVIVPAHRSLALKADMYQADTALAVAYFALNEKDKSKQYYDSAVLHGANAEKLSSILNGMTYGNVSFADTSEVGEKVVRAVGHLQRDTAIPMVEVRLPAPEDGNYSRLGGAPVDINVPIDSTGRPMKLLAAIWCSEIRGVPDFPSCGVLRFYVADNDLYGADPDHPTIQSDFKVLFDKNEDGFNSEQIDDPSVSPSFPIQQVLPIRLTPAIGSIRSSDHRFEECVAAALKKAGIEEGTENLNDAEYDFIFNQNSYAGHRIGGYPCFEQSDPRSDAELQKYDTLLLQIVSHSVPDGQGGEKDLIMFGNNGGCQFFIHRDKLIARDFSDVMYYWDECDT